MLGDALDVGAQHNMTFGADQKLDDEVCVSRTFQLWTCFLYASARALIVVVSSDSSAKSMEAWKCICASLSCVSRCGNLTEVSLPSTLFSTGE